jgi:hypothetical protein
MQSRPTTGILAKLRAMVRGDTSKGETQPAPVVPEPSEQNAPPAPVAAGQPPAKEG